MLTAPTTKTKAQIARLTLGTILGISAFSSSLTPTASAAASEIPGALPIPALPFGITIPVFPQPGIGAQADSSRTTDDNPEGAAESATLPDITLDNIPERTSMAIIAPWGTLATPNADEPRAALSIIKLYLADYVLRKGDHSAEDKRLAEAMIRRSDDGAAQALDLKYPQAIDSVAQEYGLTNTWRGTHWGTSMTSAMDTVHYLNTVQHRRPNSYILRWMRQAAPIAADGTEQNWGTAHLPGVEGTKWGWSDFGPETVASASIGADFAAAAFTKGDASVQNSDVEGVIKHMR